MNRSERRKKATKIVNRYALLCAAAAAATGPIPITSVVLMMAETKMVFDIAAVYAFKPTAGEASTVVSGLLTVSAPLKVAALGASAIPGIGWFVAKPAIAASACKAIGALIIGYYEKKYDEGVQAA